MFKFRHFKILCLVTFTVLFIAESLGEVPLYVYLGLAVLLFALLIYGSFWLSSQFFISSINQKYTDAPQVTLTFDDGPEPGQTDAILALLEQHQVKGTFFCIGKKTREHKNLLKRIDNKGHLIGNHSFSHSPLLPFFLPRKLKRDLFQSEQLIKQVTGKNPRYYRPPFGAMSPQYASVIRQLGYITIGWNLRSFDTLIKDENILYQRLVKKTCPGSIVLFHDTQPHLLPVLDKYLTYLRKQGYSILRLDELTGVAPYRKRPLPADQHR